MTDPTLDILRRACRAIERLEAERDEARDQVVATAKLLGAADALLTHLEQVRTSNGDLLPLQLRQEISAYLRGAG